MVCAWQERCLVLIEDLLLVTRDLLSVLRVAELKRAIVLSRSMKLQGCSVMMLRPDSCWERYVIAWPAFIQIISIDSLT